ncbi:signal peptidase I . Serine peptidase. MEROPS family S26A [Klenkia soli]|uniref:Signal peptidase I n=1 Tax=Klenkia soli TaxID=1052260 RepID=A0A1H0BH81_9ACTN|nr:signal peptidase I [Klenkia soli]SDN44991.1 signal peptidase I . Serine peptidase. MEROPS family S26A [Klenkia soli]
MAEKKEQRSLLKELPVLLLVAVVLAVVVKTFLVQPFYIPSASMEQTLHGCPGCTADRILVTKPPYWFSDPQPGDVVVFEGPAAWPSETQADEPTNWLSRAALFVGRAVGVARPSDRDFVKRVVAVGGQTVQCCDDQGRVTVDGRPLDEPYLYQDDQRAFGPVTLEAGQLWVMGDHRSDSADSRDHGPIGVDDVIGKASVIVWPLSRFGWIDSPDIQDTTASGPVDPGTAVLLAPVLLAVRRRR